MYHLLLLAEHVGNDCGFEIIIFIADDSLVRTLSRTLCSTAGPLELPGPRFDHSDTLQTLSLVQSNTDDITMM